MTDPEHRPIDSTTGVRCTCVNWPKLPMAFHEPECAVSVAYDAGKRMPSYEDLPCACGHLHSIYARCGNQACGCLQHSKAYPEETGVVTDAAPKTFEEALDRTIEQARQLMLNRQEKYGSGNIDRHGEMGIRVRLDDKVARLGNMKDFPDESRLDSWLDVVNYGLIGAMLNQDRWGLPLDNDHTTQ